MEKPVGIRGSPFPGVVSSFGCRCRTDIRSDSSASHRPEMLSVEQTSQTLCGTSVTVCRIAVVGRWNCVSALIALAVWGLQEVRPGACYTKIITSQPEQLASLGFFALRIL